MTVNFSVMDIDVVKLPNAQKELKTKSAQGHLRPSQQARTNDFPLPITTTSPPQIYNMESENPAYHFSNHHYIWAQILVHAEDV